ncbi:MAG: hypothetical protein Q9223_003776 [Gallowayella weberi]
MAVAKRMEEREKEEVEMRDGSGAEDDDSGDGTETEGGGREREAVRGSAVHDGLDEGIRKRRSLGSSTGDVSTDSEWDKVEEADT